ncbi:Mg2+ and Co2+ transporter CorA [Streptomyces sp. SLBN-8D4]
MTLAKNEDMRQITAWAAIIAVPTMVRFGYPMALAVIATACFVVYRGFKRNGRL